MNSDLRVWKNELLKKYRFNKFEFLKKTKAMFFKFDDKLIFNQYLFKKINLLHDVKIANENIMINYFWNGLNVKLTLTISLKKDEDTFENFDRHVRQNETTAKKIHDLKKKRPMKKFTKEFYAKEIYTLKSKYQRRQDDLSSKKIQKLLTKFSFKKIKKKPWI